jgi:gluconolactonase
MSRQHARSSGDDHSRNVAEESSSGLLDLPQSFDILADGLLFPEGPLAYADGSVILCEILRGTLTRVWNGRTEVIADLGGGPNGAAVGPDGAIYVCNNGGFAWSRSSDGALHVTARPPADYEGGRIERVCLSSGKIDRLYTHVEGHSLRGPNDIVFDSTGGFWFTDLGKESERGRDKSGVYYARPDGGDIREVLYDGLSFNGIGLSPDEATLYVADTLSGRLWAYDLAAPGVITQDEAGKPKGRLIGRLPDAAALDSMAVTEAGNVCVGTLGRGGITTFTPAGAMHFLPYPDYAVTNICFGGADRHTAYLTFSMGGLLARSSWNEPGHPLNFVTY